MQSSAILAGSGLHSNSCRRVLLDLRPLCHTVLWCKVPDSDSVMTVKAVLSARRQTFHVTALDSATLHAPIVKLITGLQSVLLAPTHSLYLACVVTQVLCSCQL